MKQAFHTVTVPTKGPGLYEFTDEAAAFVRGEKIADGLLTCFVRHTSASLVIQENADPDVQKGEARFAKQTQWSSGPLRAAGCFSRPESLAGSPGLAARGDARRCGVRRGERSTGPFAHPGSPWQGLYLFEHRDAPHRREVMLHIIGD
ncbi:MAG TPA: YjbQ family protein [Rhizomicrobium sp.]|nr:YjbQ family protein [Rhizomicrobium sp.]